MTSPSGFKCPKAATDRILGVLLARLDDAGVLGWKRKIYRTVAVLKARAVTIVAITVHRVEGFNNSLFSESESGFIVC